MIKHTDILSVAEFHAYVDSQLPDHQYETIEKRLLESPQTIVNLQNCLLINEKLQRCFDETEVELEHVVEETIEYDLSATEHLIPSEPELSTLSEHDTDTAEIAALDEFVDVESMDLHASPQAPLELKVDTILPPSLNNEVFLPEENMPVANGTELDPADYDIEIPELNISAPQPPELLVQKETVQQARQVPPILVNSSPDTPHNPATDVAEDDIDVDDFLKGINETHMVDSNLSAMTQKSLSKDIFASSNSSRSFLSPIKTAIRRLIEKIRARSQGADPQILALENEMDAKIQNFEIDINEAIDTTPKLRFWHFRVKHAADDALNSVKEQLEPMAPTVSPWLANINATVTNINLQLRKVSFIDKSFNHSYWILSGLIVGLFLGSWLFSAETSMNDSEREQLATDAHVYFSKQGANVVKGGNDDFKQNILWLQKRWGKRISSIDVSSAMKFRRKGATLSPTRSGYASVQMFENFSSERITVFVSRLNDNAENTRVRCHISKTIDGICSWKNNALSYFVIGDLSLSRIRHFASLVAAKQ